jgi:hypothetical protein|tara:strand:+ start:463 stop:579 length:117 start_codon:yes stop_codon:yes gene_type:complete
MLYPVNKVNKLIQRKNWYGLPEKTQRKKKNRLKEKKST